MFWKTFVVALFVVGVFADEYDFTQERKDQVKGALRTMCEKVGAADKVDEVANVTNAFVECVKDLVNVNQLKDEIEAAKPNGALDEVFKKYCEKTPLLKTCIHNVLEGFKPCLDENTKNSIGSAKNSTDQLIDFVCYKDGDRIALFISEGGPECLEHKVIPMRECVNKIRDTLPRTENGSPDVKNMSESDRCATYDQLSRCIVTALEGCTTPTPANMAESLLKHIRKTSPCEDGKN